MAICPFCNHDPYEYVDVGVGSVPVAVTCCELGIELFDHRKRRDEITVYRDEFDKIVTKLTQRQALIPAMEESHSIIEWLLEGRELDEMDRVRLNKWSQLCQRAELEFELAALAAKT